MPLDNYDPSTALSAYYPTRDERRPARLWATEKLLHDMAELGMVEFFEGAGTNPTSLSGYATTKLWLRVSSGVTDEPGEVRSYDGSGDATLLASWPLLTRGAFLEFLGVSADLGRYETRQDVQSASIGAGVNGVTTLGYASVGDGGAATYKRVGSEPSHAGKVQSADGAWWELAPTGNVYANQFGFLTTGTAAANATALQNAINYAKTQTETLLANKYVIVTSSVLIHRGEYNVSGTINLYSGVSIQGCGQANTLLVHSGGGVDFLVYTSNSPSETLYDIWVRDIAIKGGGKTSSDTLAAIRSDSDTGALSIYGCGVQRCYFSNCYDAIGLENSWTFEVSDCEMYDMGRSFMRGNNMTSVKIIGNRFDVAAEDGIYITFSAASGFETIAMHIERTVVQSCGRRAIYGYDADHVMWDHTYVEACNQDGGYPHVEFASNSGTNAEMYSFSGGWASVGSGGSGQSAFKIATARMVTSNGIYIRGNAFSLGWELGSGVQGYSIHGEFNGGTFISVSGDTPGMAVSRLAVSIHGVDSETQATSQSASNANSSLTTRAQQLNCTSGNRTYTLLDSHLQVGRRFTVEKVDGGSNGLIIAPEGTTKINGVNASVESTEPYARAEIICGFEAGTTTPCWFVQFITDNTRPRLGSNALATLASGVATISSSYSRIDTEGAAATDDCDTITYPGVTDGTIIVVRSANSVRDVTFKDGTGNLNLAGDFLCNSVADRLVLIWEGSAWAELSRSANT